MKRVPLVPVIFEKSVAGRIGHELPRLDTGANEIIEQAALESGPDINIFGIDQKYLASEPIKLPELSEPDVVRHYTALSKLNHGVDSGFYPLGSCTMKYNPKINEDVSGYFADTHPMADAPGNLRLMGELSDMLCEITGMDRISLQPSAGAHGELAGLMIIKAYHLNRGDSKRTKMLIPSTAHGTNPASAMMAGFETVEIAADKDGNVDLTDLKKQLEIGKGEIGGLMLTNPSTLGLFEINILEIAKLVHDAGGLLYYDGANLNAIMGLVRPGDMGFDVIHLNLHKTFSTPHGGGGPGSGPVGVKAILAEYLPVPVIEANPNGLGYILTSEKPLSIGKTRSFYGNFGVMVKAYAYIMTMGAPGLREATENAIINANYLRKRLSEFLEIAIDRPCMHEFVATGAAQKAGGSSTLDMAKRMIDFGVHPPTVYFPLIVKEALMIEPTETESKETLDEFVEVMRAIVAEAKDDPEKLRNAPYNAPVGRLDDTKAARKPVLVWK